MSASFEDNFLAKKKSNCLERKQMITPYQLSISVIGVGVQSNQFREKPVENSLFKSFGPSYPCK